MLYLGYVDPTSGGMLLQLLSAGLAGVAVIIKLNWNRVRSAITGKRSSSPALPASQESRPEGQRAAHKP